MFAVCGHASEEVLGMNGLCWRWWWWETRLTPALLQQRILADPSLRIAAAQPELDLARMLRSPKHPFLLG